MPRDGSRPQNQPEQKIRQDPIQGMKEYVRQFERKRISTRHVLVDGEAQHTQWPTERGTDSRDKDVPKTGQGILSTRERGITDYIRIIIKNEAAGQSRGINQQDRQKYQAGPKNVINPAIAHRSVQSKTPQSVSP